MFRDVGKWEVPLGRKSIEFPNASSALLALASESERVAYERELETIWRNEYGEEVCDDRLEKILLPRLMEKLGSGAWIASGFGYESGQPTDLDPRLWQRLAINVRRNTAGDAWANVSIRSATGSFHSLGFRVAASGTTRDSSHPPRAKVISQIARLFEKIDPKIPANAGKKRFFEEARLHFKVPLPEAWLKEAWKNAQLRPFRRQAGLKSNQSNFRPPD